MARKEKQNERPRKKDRNRKEVHILAYAHVPQTKMKLDYFILSHDVAGNYATVLKILFLGIFALNWEKIGSKKEILLKKFFFSLLIINFHIFQGVTFWLSFLHVCSQDDWEGDDVFVHKDTEADYLSDDKQPELK